MMTELVTRLTETGRMVADRWSNLFYEATHVTKVDSYGYNVSNQIALTILVVVSFTVIALINSPGFASFLWDLGEKIDEKRAKARREKGAK